MGKPSMFHGLTTVQRVSPTQCRPHAAHLLCFVQASKSWSLAGENVCSIEIFESHKNMDIWLDLQQWVIYFCRTWLIHDT